jgi:uncharacterized protein (DUF2249 family)/hemerythrin-like domain-containing protein
MPHPIRHLDIRDVPPQRRGDEVLGAFEALALDQVFILVTDEDPKRLLLQFQARHPGGFEWSVLESRPDRVRVEVRRRAGDTSRTVADYLESDHRRLDLILPMVDRLVGEGDLAGAREQFAEFSCGLNRHIEAEEQVLFPDFERRTGMTTGPTVVMRQEHLEIRRWMTRATTALEAGDAAGYQDASQQLVGVLVPHNMKEEQILYPMADRAAGDSDTRDDLVRQMQAL